SHAMRIVRTVGQAFDVCHQLTLQQKSEDQEDEEGRAEELEAAPGYSHLRTHLQLRNTSLHFALLPIVRLAPSQFHTKAQKLLGLILTQIKLQYSKKNFIILHRYYYYFVQIKDADCWPWLWR
ncbi:hypothetical protein CHARACLAT_007975, partial [Characodon lateralis]|nr:hypothetical protein [Characodon lateralis]